MSVDPHLLALWARGWALTRGATPPVRDGDAWRIEVGAPDQLRRYVYSDVCPEIERRAAEITEPFVLLKVCAAPGQVRPLFSEAWDVRQTGVLMRIDAPMTRGPVGDPSWRADFWSDGPVRFCVLRDVSGEEAARGRAVRVEDRVVYDRIAVSAHHRRRGLGGRIMRTLEAEVGAGLPGVLVATDEGSRLYATLGWREISPYVTAVRL